MNNPNIPNREHAADTPKPGKSSTSERVASAAHDAVDQAASHAKRFESDVRERASKAGDQLESTQRAANRQLNDSISQAEEFVREKPLAAAGIAFAAGAILTTLLRR